MWNLFALTAHVAGALCSRTSTVARQALVAIWKKPKQRNLPHVCNDIDRKEQQRFNLDNSRSHKKGNHEKQSPDTHTRRGALLFAVSYVCLTIFSVHSNRPFWTGCLELCEKNTAQKENSYITNELGDVLWQYWKLPPCWFSFVVSVVWRGVLGIPCGRTFLIAHNPFIHTLPVE